MLRILAYGIKFKISRKVYRQTYINQICYANANSELGD